MERMEHYEVALFAMLPMPMKLRRSLPANTPHPAGRKDRARRPGRRSRLYRNLPVKLEHGV
jgi:hypothetical protein